MTNRVPLPPARLRFMDKTDDDFLRVGEFHRQDLVEVAGLNHTSTVLEIGCGYGRIAHALLRWSEFTGRYLGMDPLREQIKWCRKKLTPASGRRFEFRHLDVHNGRYNPKGKLRAPDVDFGVVGTADVVLLASVFTHMYPEAVIRYLAQIERALSPAGKAYVTFFLMNESWAAREASGLSQFPLPHTHTAFCRYWKEEDPLHVIGYDEAWVREQVALAGLRVIEPVRLGTWCGRVDGEDIPASHGRPRWQDVVVLAKARPPVMLG